MSHGYQASQASVGNLYLHARNHFTAISTASDQLLWRAKSKDPVSTTSGDNTNLAHARIRLAVDQVGPRTASLTRPTPILAPAAAFALAVCVQRRDPNASGCQASHLQPDHG